MIKLISPQNKKIQAMYVEAIIHKMLSSVMHLKRLSALSSIVNCAFEAKQLSVTGLGRALQAPIQERSGIRKVDRLVGNKKLHAQRENVYKTIATQLIGNKRRPWLLVDWSPIPNTTDNLLRAALVCEGRALSVYEEVHPEKKLGNRTIHKLFLDSLKRVLPETCCPILVTDAGYHTSWFKAVKKLSWDFVGRVRGTVTYCPEGEQDWLGLKALHQKANKNAKQLGSVLLSKTEPCEGVICYYKGKSKGRISRNKLGNKRQCSHSKERSKSAKEPWILMTSLTGRNVAKQVVKIYRTRMQIEEGFRDLKSSQYGFGFERSYSYKIARIEILLMIAMLASLVAWQIGWQAERENLHYEFQANSIKDRRVLSLFYLGVRVIKKKIRLTLKSLSEITEQLEWARSETC